jgi:hypothetical protein
MEDLELPPESVDLVVASLCVHDDANHAPDPRRDRIA